MNEGKVDDVLMSHIGRENKEFQCRGENFKKIMTVLKEKL